MKRVSVLLITLALLLGMVGCPADPVHDPEIDPGPPAQYTLTISSTEGGNVTTPGEGVFTYDEGTVVQLVAEADEGYSFVKWTGDVDTVNIVNAPRTTVTVEDNCSITASFEFWSIEITNKDDQNDYPASVQSEGTYNTTVNLTVNIPAGKTGAVSVVASTAVFFDPPPYTLRWLDPPRQKYWTVFENGTHKAELSFAFSTPGVRRESWADIDLTAELFDRDQRRDRDFHLYGLTILPSEESAVDVEFTGTVESLDVFWDMVVVGAYIRIDEVTIEDPWSVLVAGNTIYVGFEAAPSVEKVSIGAGDKVEVYCDYHCDEGDFALIWRPVHYITQVQPSAPAWVVVALAGGLAVAAVVVYFLWRRRRLRG